ncbi:TetR/AcrR family transcriptional regulator [Antrihabitans sp. YC2-6]|nr:TetR/AcrR family transcriptional regulator [Antrihabitans sp. YC2-6]
MDAVSTARKRSRLSTEERRAQLLDVGARVFGARPFDDISLEDVAEQAGVSPGLLYHYFGGKREFAAAVIESQSTRFLEMTKADESLPVEKQLLGALDAYLQYVEANEHGYRALHSPGMMADKSVAQLSRAGMRLQEQRIAAALGFSEDIPAEIALAIHGWIAFTIAVCLRWLDQRNRTRAQVRDLCANSLRAILNATGLVSLDDPPT